MKATEKTMDTIVNLCKARGFIYPGSEIYGGLSNSWDYGPLGVEFKNNVKKAWWKKFIQESPYNVGVDAAILMNPQVWVATGHVGGFSDPLMDCKDCKTRHRADKLIEDFHRRVCRRLVQRPDDDLHPGAPHQVPQLRQREFHRDPPVQPDVQNLPGRDRRREETRSTSAPRPPRGIFVNFPNVQRTTRKKLPFGIGQIGKSFRNEITPATSPSAPGSSSRWS